MKSQPVYSTLINDSGQILSCNNLLRKQLGFSEPGQLIGKSIFEVFKSWEIEKLAQAIDSCKMDPELSITVTVRYKSADKQEHQYEWTITQEESESGQPVLHLVGRVQTRKKRTPGAEALDASILFSQFMEHSPIVGWVTDEDGIMQYMNPIYQATYHFAEDQVGRSIFELFPADIAQEYFENNKIVLREGKAIETIEKGLTADGREQTLKIFKFPLTIGNKRLIAGWAIDITDQIAMQNELGKIVERFYFVKKATSDAIYDWDVQKNIIYRGLGFQTLFGYPDLRGSIRFSFHHIHPHDLERVKATVFEALRNPEADRWNIEYSFRDAHGNYKRVVDKAFIIREEGRTLRVIGAMQDISEQAFLQERLLQQEKAAKREIVRSIIDAEEKERRQLSVELHDNVNQILSSCKLMLDVAKGNPEQAGFLTEKAGFHLQTAISEIRRISHELNPSALQDIGLIEGISQLIDPINAAGTMRIEFHQEGCLSRDCLKEVDRVAVYRIVQEKLTNILKHSSAKTALISLSLKKDMLRLIMQDDGVGFDLAKAKRGMGLRNIQNRVAYYQGKMRLTAAPGKGCKMEIRMRMDMNC